jgi:hypothetical protein
MVEAMCALVLVDHALRQQATLLGNAKKSLGTDLARKPAGRRKLK